MRRVHRMKAVANRPIIRKPIPAMTRKVQNIGVTPGMVSRAAASIMAAVASVTSGVYFFRSGRHAWAWLLGANAVGLGLWWLLWQGGAA